MIVKKYVTSDSLASLLLLEKRLEPTPEAFRCQPNVVFSIDFQEYINFVTFYLGKVDYLATPTEELLKLVKLYRQGDIKAKEKLFQAFLTDMSFAVAKELYFAEASGKGATNIIHTTDNTVILNSDDINNYFVNVVERVTPRLLSRLSYKGYEFGSQISGRNAHIWKYAIVLNYLAEQSFQWSYSCTR